MAIAFIFIGHHRSNNCGLNCPLSNLERSFKRLYSEKRSSFKPRRIYIRKSNRGLSEAQHGAEGDRPEVRQRFFILDLNGFLKRLQFSRCRADICDSYDVLSATGGSNKSRRNYGRPLLSPFRSLRRNGLRSFVRRSQASARLFDEPACRAA